VVEGFDAMNIQHKPRAPQVLLTIEEHKGPPRRDQLFLRPSRQWLVPPQRLTITVEADHALYALGKGMNVGHFHPEPLSGGGALDGNAAVSGLHEALNEFREEFTDHLNAIDGEDVKKRLTKYKPTSEWNLPPKPLDGRPAKADRDRWREMEASPRLWRLAEFGHQLYQQVFPPESQLRKLMDDLAGGALLQIQWQRNTRGRIPNLPWTLMYARPPAVKGQPIDPRHFLGLRHRISYLVRWTSDDQGLGDPSRAQRMYSYYWDGDDETLTESRLQHGLWAGPETYHLVPGEPGRLQCEATVARALLIDSLRRPPWDPLALIYLFCKGDMIQSQFNLYFAGGGEREVILPVEEIPSDPLTASPLVFVNACKAGGAANPTVANPLEKRFLDRGCRAFVGPVSYIPIRLASRFAQVFFHFFLGHGPTGRLLLARLLPKPGGSSGGSFATSAACSIVMSMIIISIWLMVVNWHGNSRPEAGSGRGRGHNDENSRPGGCVPQG
jgi:hypothetical protein